MTPLPPAKPGETSPRPGWFARLGGSILFYTKLPLPSGWQPRFEGIAPLAPVVGLALGLGLVGVDFALGQLGMPTLTRSALVIGLGVWVTGGLHLDGAMDTADGLAVMDPERRLAAMADSHSGAFGVMAAIAILGLKTLALAELATGRGGVLVAAMVWGRWGQVVAIARYPYLRAEGKGALHREHLRSPQDWLLGLGLALAVHGIWAWRCPDQLLLVGISLVGGLGLALATGAWLDRCLGGHTGDTYGATVEWTETLLLCLATLA
ncbi:adenosylcobinamide-GDP ribazoletransferase [Nodosilinea sp. LEGE 06152]|uniref:adenosylcobinamide-GDP ribazoletransferase n=1 Tax=Nodosilinea sp. LEGE 06152 TaxID=2777966 RepID=UPI00187E9278|nr:adenosylcobinamide-GDP ribazoletransferase [Nodosilinea sp. LEGE 06152]MBE9157575.1 adenosylcobinamide-GDP ribazoletransferase [Nodosilinea sp. LEGE 06152]